MNPPDHSPRESLIDGRRIAIRPIRPADGASLRLAFERLSPASRYSRFLHHRAELSDDAVRYLTDVDGHDHCALVALAETLDLKEELGVAVGRFIRLPDEPRAAEVAITVLDGWQGAGLGSRLLRRLAATALEVGVDVFRADMLADHRALRTLVGRGHARIVERDGSTVALELDVAQLVDDAPHLPFEPPRAPARHLARS